MRIAYLVDVHGRFDVVPRVLQEIGDVDLLLVGGDLTTGGSPDDVAHAVESWLPLVPRLLAVIRRFVESEQPDLVLCGHIHESRGADTIGRSRVVNPGPLGSGHYAVVDIGDGVTVALDDA